jgi:hypothetical protein
MENAATTPRPSTEALDSLFQVFREPFAESTRFATLTDQMRLAVQEAESDPARAGEVAALRDSLQVLEARQAEASRRLTLVRNEVGPRIDSLRTIMREWEAEAFRGWAEVTQSLTSGRLAPGITDTTGQDGRAELSLPPGSRSWWVYARSFNSGDPHSEWYWNLPASGPTMILDTSTARLRPRY